MDTPYPGIPALAFYQQRLVSSIAEKVLGLQDLSTVEDTGNIVDVDYGHTYGHAGNIYHGHIDGHAYI